MRINEPGFKGTLQSQDEDESLSTDINIAVPSKGQHQADCEIILHDLNRNLLRKDQMKSKTSKNASSKTSSFKTQKLNFLWFGLSSQEK